MAKLREQIGESIVATDSNGNPIQLIISDPSIKNWKAFAEIADEHAIGFVNWLTDEKSQYSVMYGNQEKRFADFDKEYTTAELLEIYKSQTK